MPMIRPRNPLLVALDTPDLGRAGELADALADVVGGVKLGLEFFAANGPAGVAEITGRGLALFLDLKFHDIPNTVAGAVRAVLDLKPAMLTVHASGGPAMLRAAADAALEGGAGRPLVLGITVLTSLAEEDLEKVGQRGPVAEQVLRLAALSTFSHLDGAVCSPHEIRALREARGPGYHLVVPGIRPAGSDTGDQKRVMTPAEARAAGADYLVVGRPITEADDPVAAARAILDEIEEAR